MALLSAVLVGACGDPPPESLLAKARSSVASQEFETATLHLKTLLQRESESSEGRYLLGVALLGQEQPEAAAIELRKALALGHPAAEARLMLARALLASRQTKALIEEFRADFVGTPQQHGEVKALVAAALATERQFDEARVQAAQALALDNQLLPALLVNARLAAAAGNTAAAESSARRALELHPDDRDALLLNAEVLWILRGDVAAARSLLVKGVERYPRHLPTFGLLLSLMAQQNDMEGLKKYSDLLAQRHPNHPETVLWQARAAQRTGYLERARSLSQDLLKALPDNGIVLELAGSIELERGSLTAAEPLLSKALQVQPGLSAARLALAATYLRAGQPQRALTTLEPLVQGNSTADALMTAGAAHAALRQHAQAAKMFSRAAELKPSDGTIGAAAAVSMIDAGDRAGGMARLEMLAGSSPDSAADLALYSVRVVQGDLDGARSALDQAIQKDPRPVFALLYRAELQLRLGLPDAARADLERAASLDPSFLDASVGLALLDAGQGRFGPSVQRLRDYGQRYPAQARSRIALADLLRISGADPDEVSAVLADGIRAEPANAAVRARLVAHLLRSGQSQAARQTAQDAASALPDRPEVLDALATALIATGDSQQGLAALARVVSLLPAAPQPLVRLGDAHMVLKDYAAAEAAFRRAASLAPDFLPAQRGLIQTALLQGRGEQAVERARQLQRQPNTSQVGLVVETEVQAALKNWPAAVAAARRAFEQARNSESVIRLHSTLLQAGRRAEAESVAAEWQRGNANDLVFLSHLASLALFEGRLEQSEQIYQRILARVANDPMALNNLAWIQVQRKDPQAVATAERAVSAAPDSPAALDTLAAALAQTGNRAKALETQRRAVKLAPDAPLLQLHLAQMLIEADQRTEAKTILERLRRLGGRFDKQDEVGRLLSRT
jgi:putative PEP-CTERM system TPR-repeat lipoprotein